MYYLLSIVVGVVISFMISINGQLSLVYGSYVAAVIIHIVGVLFAILLCLIKKERFKIKKKIPFWVFLGGAIGVLTTLFNNYSFGYLSVTSILSLSLLGQSITSVIFDWTGFLGLTKRKPNKLSIFGYLTSIFGIFILLDQSVSNSLLAVLLSLFAGFTIVVSRTINAKLSSVTSPLISSLINHCVGLPICILLVLFFQQSLLVPLYITNSWIYLGGILGVLTVILFNITVPKVSAFHLTLLSFSGQVFTGIILDVILGLSFSFATFIGSLVISTGLLLNILLEYKN